MKIARYWEKATVPAHLPSGKTIPVLGWGWSEDNRDEARQRATGAAQRAAGWLESKTGSLRSYGYSDRPPREEILREIKNAQGETIAAITRNAYGVEVLNAQNLMFIDVDIPEENTFGATKRKIQRLFGKKVQEPELQIHQRVVATANNHRQYTFRIYRTAAGFRCVLVNQAMSTPDAESRRLLEEFGADKLYQKLCHSQECYRARLTPKFWRCRSQRPPNRFPWSSPEDELKYRAWQQKYEKDCQPFATCLFIEQVGNQAGHETLQSLVALHDEATRAGSGLPLA